MCSVDSRTATPCAPAPALARRAAGLRSSPVRDLLALTARPEVISFAGGLPAPDLLDAAGIRRAYDHVLAEPSARSLQYSTTEGDPDLRALLAGRLARRGLPTSPDGLLVTTGSQQALALLGTALLDPGDVVLVEDPTYLAALQCFGLAGARVIAVPTDDDGVRPDDLDQAVARHQPRLLYLVPTFQNPTGRTMPGHRRRAVAEIAARRGLWIVEDDPYGELRFEGAAEPWIAADPIAADRTVLLGSLSKTMAPGMRLGWLRAPDPLRRACVIAKQATDLHSSTIDQAAAARYLRDGAPADPNPPAVGPAAGPDGHVRRMCAAYRERRDTMLAALPAALPAGSRWTTPRGGMFVWVWLPAGYDATALLPVALEHEVAYVPGAAFFAGRPDPSTLRLSFTTHPPERIAEGVARLSRALGGAMVSA